jgi:hypothetical protein
VGFPENCSNGAVISEAEAISIDNRISFMNIKNYSLVKKKCIGYFNSKKQMNDRSETFFFLLELD